MSTIAAVGGAYLALFVQARPDLMVSSGIARVLPVAGKAPTAGTTDPNLVNRIAALETALSALEAKVAAMPATAAPAVGVIPTPAPSAPPGTSSAAPKAAPAGPTGTVPAPANGTTAPAPTSPAAPAAAPSPAPAVAAVAAASATELAAIGGRVTAIETRLAALDPTGAGGAVIAGLQTEIATLKVLVSQLQGQINTAPPAGLSMAVVALAEAANRNEPFLSEFESVRAAVPDLPEAASLAALARTGAPTRALLSERFTTLTAAIAAAEAQSRDEGGLTGWFRSILASLIKVEEPATTEGSSASAILARAKLKLDAGDLAGAVNDISDISPQPDAVRNWLAGAKARLELEQKMAALRGAIDSGKFARPAAGAAAAALPPAASPATGPVTAAPAPAPSAPVGVIPTVPAPTTAPITKETTP